MDVRLSPGLRSRADGFGGVCYVPRRDDFFALDSSAFKLVRTIGNEWRGLAPDQRKAVIALARIGICETRNPTTPELAYSGPSFVGQFEDIVTLSEPLVLNCFSTAFCPLVCKYCHADDLMREFREEETDRDLHNVAATAALIPSMVAVVTGGDPLTRPRRAEYLIESLSKHKAVVLDTSGVGDFESLLPSIQRCRVHVRVSLDAISEINNALRPINKKIVGSQSGRGAREYAMHVIGRCVFEDVPITVQTVVTSRNSKFDELRDLRDWLVDTGVKHWVLHLCVPAGSARKFNELAGKSARPLPITPDGGVYKTIQKVIDDTQRNALSLDIRCTDTSGTPNSVMLVASNGDLYTEGLAKAGKNRLFEAAHARPDLIRSLWYYVDHFGHARRYLNWNPGFYTSRDLRELCYQIPEWQSEEPASNAIVETEGKFRVQDVKQVEHLLKKMASRVRPVTLERDEYYDSSDGTLSDSDYVVRVRYVNGHPEISLKGPRFWSRDEYSRVELEFPCRSRKDVESALEKKRLSRTWFFEKRRTTYLWNDGSTLLHLDEIPEFGFFLEIEGQLQSVRGIAQQLGSALGSQESRNYKEVFLSMKAQTGVEISQLVGAEFVPRGSARSKTS